MTDAQQREAARQFFYRWNGKGKEDEDARSYWIDVLVNIFDVDHVTDRVEFEKKVSEVLRHPVGAKSFGDKERLAKVFPCLMAYHEWMRENRTWRDGTYWSSGWG